MSFKERLGEFWWGTATIFVACRFADAVNAVVSVWLAPKFVGAGDLGALLPLGNFAAFLAFPISVFTVAYTRQVAELAARGELGQLKTLIRGVFFGAGILLALLPAASLVALPPFLKTVNVTCGSVGAIVVVSAFAAAVAPIFTAALQALKKFGAISLLQAVTAPMRLLTMAAIMPVRPLAGYFAGQSVPPFAAIGVALWSLRRELRVKAEPFWRRHWRQMVRLMMILALIYAVGSLSGTFQSTLLRMRLPSVDSAAYYMITRLAEIATYVGSAVAIVIFPIAAQAKSKGEDATSTLSKANRITFFSGALVAIALYCGGGWLFELIETCRPYAAYRSEMALAALSMTMGMAVCNFANFEVAQNRFGYFLWEGPLSLASLGVLYFADIASLRGFITVLLAQNVVGFTIVCLIIRTKQAGMNIRSTAAAKRSKGRLGAPLGSGRE